VACGYFIISVQPYRRRTRQRRKAHGDYRPTLSLPHFTVTKPDAAYFSVTKPDLPKKKEEEKKKKKSATGHRV